MSAKTTDRKYKNPYVQKEFITLLEDQLFELARSDFKTYISLIKPDYIFESHHDMLIQEMINLVFDNDFDRLMVLVPPREGKSELGSKLFPSWLYGVMSKRVWIGGQTPYEIIQTSYSSLLGEEFVNGFSAYCETEEWKRIFPYTRIAPRGERYGSQFSRKKGAIDFISDQGSPVFREIEGNYKKSSSCRMIGIQESITGKGGDFIILDDMVKDDKSAESQRIRDETYNWWESTLETRGEYRHGQRAKFLALNTRWHDDDLTGRLEKKGDWRVIRLPAFAYDLKSKYRSPWDKRKKDEPLSKWRTEKYQKARDTMSQRAFSALYQQLPVPEAGNIVKSKDIQFYSVQPKTFDLKFIGIDLANTGKETSNYSVVELWGLDLREVSDFKEKYYLLDQVRGQFSFSRQKQEILDFVNKHRDAEKVILEHASNADAVYEDLQFEIPHMELWKPRTEKEHRLKLVEDLYEKHKVFYPDPEEHDWVLNNIEEITKFPKSRYNDTVDVASMTLIHLKQKARDFSGYSALIKW